MFAHRSDMPNYLRPRVSGSLIFFTVNLADRGSDLLVREIGLLRAAIGAEMQVYPFILHDVVILPGHLHAVCSLLLGDTDYSARWGSIKARISRALPVGRRRHSHIKRN